MAPRNIQFAVTSGTTTIMINGQIGADDLVTGRMTLVDGTGNAAPVTVSIAGSVSGGAIEGLVFASLDTGTVDLSGTGTIDATGVMSINITGTVGGAAFAGVAVGAANDRLVHHGTAQHDSEESGATVLGIAAADPCALATKLRAIRLELIAGQGIARTEVAGRSVYFQKGDLAALEREIARLDAACATANGTTIKPSETPRTRRAIRFNPYL
ncbi:MAG: hypothetical protein VR78_11030 [Hoeflea sp. BRH_c9]|nr:MAG: hypothetical protein VR78_11030 [Hoeflea sp. BRH_c9]